MIRFYLCQSRSLAHHIHYNSVLADVPSMFAACSHRTCVFFCSVPTVSQEPECSSPSSPFPFIVMSSSCITRIRSSRRNDGSSCVSWASTLAANLHAVLGVIRPGPGEPSSQCSDIRLCSLVDQSHSTPSVEFTDGSGQQSTLKDQPSGDYPRQADDLHVRDTDCRRESDFLCHSTQLVFRRWSTDLPYVFGARFDAVKWTDLQTSSATPKPSKRTRVADVNFPPTHECWRSSG